MHLEKNKKYIHKKCKISEKNSKRNVFQNILHQFAPIITVLEEQIMAGIQNRIDDEKCDSRVREKGIKARELKGKILNTEFMFLLCGLADIYEQFGEIVQVTQMVGLLPHERMDKYDGYVLVLKEMASCLPDHAKCPVPEEGKKCKFSRSHQEKESWKTSKTIRGLPVIDKSAQRACGLQLITRGMENNNIIQVSDDIEEKTNEKLIQLTLDLAKHLSEDVISEEARKVIEHTRVILDLPALVKHLRAPGASPVNVSVKTFHKFYDAIIKIPIPSLKQVPQDELRRQFTDFLGRLFAASEKITNEHLNKDETCQDLIKMFFDPAGELFLGIEMIMQAVAVSSLKVSCESVLKSFVSRFENHFYSNRNLSEDGMNEEFEIAVNGPDIAHCDSVVKQALNLYFRDKDSPWKFYKTSVSEKLKVF